TIEYLELLKGDLGGNKIFDGINTRWTRVKGGAEIEKILLPIEENFNFVNPAVHIPQLLKAYKLIGDLEDEHWKKIKLEQIKNIIAACSGLFIETTTNIASAIPGTQIKIQANILNRSEVEMELSKITIAPSHKEFKLHKFLDNNNLETLSMDFRIPEESKYSNPYWLNEPSSLGMYMAPLELRGKPRTPIAIPTIVTVIIQGIPVDFQRAAVYKYAKPDEGERYQPFEILPKVMINAKDNVMVFADQQPKPLSLSVTSATN